MIIIHRPDAAHELLDLKHAVVAVDRLSRNAEELGIRPLFVPNDVAIRFAQEFIARLAVNAHAELVAHGAGGDKQGRLFAEHFGDSLFQAAHGWVFAEHIVADFGRRHGGAHAGCRTSYGIAA